MSKSNYIPVRLSDTELEMVKETGKYVGAGDTSKSIRYSIASTNLALKSMKGSPPLLKPGEAVVILPEKLVSKIEKLDMPNDLTFADRCWALLFKWDL